MGDAENTLPPSKKRAAGRELSRDNPGLDDDDEVPGQETGTFKRASDEVLANRRIVKVRRSQTSSTPPAPSSNPFAAIRLVPPPAPTAVESPSSVNKEPKKGEDDDCKPPESKVDDEEEKEGASEVRKPESIDTEAKKEGNDENAPVPDTAKGEAFEAKIDTESEPGKDGVDRNEENDEKTPVPASVSSFQQLSSSQNAFTGLVGTGFSSSTFSFGSIPKPDQPTFPSFAFGTNGNSSLFGTPSGSSLTKSETTKIPPMQEVPVETGEENEKAVFTADSALFEFLDGGWKERGKGELKVNVPTTGTRKARLVMRARGNYRLILNASIFPDMKLTNMEKKGITFACLNSTGEGKEGLSTFALKFKDPSIVDEFRSIVAEYKVTAPTAAGDGGSTLKTPENSPKASDE